MKKKAVPRYGGILLDAVRDQMGLVEVVQRGDTRSLHFGSTIEQSSYVPDMPDWLQFDYCRQLLLATVFPAVVDEVLLLGLGAGTLARYLLRHGAAPLRLDAVEYREVVADMAYRHFDLPIDPRLEIYIATAEQFLDAFERRWHVIVVDLYDAEGMNEEPARLRFLDTCRERLAPGGVMAINLWRTDADEFAAMLARLDQAFSGRLLLADADDANTVVYCFEAALPTLSAQGFQQQLHGRAKALAFDGEAFLGTLYPFSAEPRKN